MGKLSDALKAGSAREPFRSFFQLDQQPTLKGLFDNVRNYFVCAALFALAGWLHKDGGATAVIAIAIALWLLNFLNTMFIVTQFLLIGTARYVDAAMELPAWSRVVAAALFVLLGGFAAEGFVYLCIGIGVAVFTGGGRLQ